MLNARKNYSSMLTKILCTGVLALIISIVVMAQSQNGKVDFFYFVKIGTQEWMSRDLNVVHYRNGDTIPEARSEEEWKSYGKAGKGCWCYYNNDSTNGLKYGKLYNGYAVMDPRGLAPLGWHIPNDGEWGILRYSINGYYTEYPFGTIAESDELKATGEWKYDKNISNKSGFTALPNGQRNFNGKFRYMGRNGYWWCLRMYRPYQLGIESLNATSGLILYGNEKKTKGFAVRCVKD